ncbi:MAG: hypothetical protein ICV73_25025 [Acetobacteraceae bacterium]|nr:hypothetical protein [Acetobacteraceae bacterium]
MSIGWLVRTTGTGAGARRLRGLFPVHIGARCRTYQWLLRDGAVRAYLLNGFESWDRGRRHVESLEAAVERGRIKRVG